jgi:hypothetical protein
MIMEIAQEGEDGASAGYVDFKIVSIFQKAKRE